MTPKLFAQYIAVMRRTGVMVATIDGTHIELGAEPRKLEKRSSAKMTPTTGRTEGLDPDDEMTFAHTEGFKHHGRFPDDA